MLAGEVDEACAIWTRYLLAVPFALPFLFFGIPHLSARFFLLQLVAFPLEMVALFLYMHAIRISPLSLTIPFLSLTPVFLLLFGFLALGERPGLMQGAGVVLVGAGGYVLSSRSWVPLSAILREPGSWLMIVVSVIYTFTAILGKVLIRESSPSFYACYYLVAMTLLLTPFALLRRKRTLHFSRNVMLMGFFHGGMVLTHMFAVALVNVAYFIALKRMAGLLSVVYGRVFFHEGYLFRRAIAAGMMLLGAVLVSL